MKLTRKLSFAIGLGIFVVLGIHAWTRVLLDRENYRADVARDQAILGESLARIVEMLWRTDGARRALDAVEHQNSSHAHITIRWVERDADSDSGDRPIRRDLVRGNERRPVHAVIRDRGADALLTYVPVNVPGRTAAIELLERLDGERRAQRASLVRAAVTMFALVIVCFVIALGFGVFFVARPMRRLVDVAQKVGDGRPVERVELAQRDEIGDLASAINAMVDRLHAARASEQEAVAARIDALEQLRHSDRLRTIGEIASAIAHELGTPLNVVRARGAMISSGEVSAERARELGHVVVEQSDKMARIIRSLLDYARRDAVRLTEVSADKIVHSVVHLLAPVAHERGVSLVVSTPTEAPNVAIDPAGIRQALTNVVVNAIHASNRDGTVAVVVHTADDGIEIEVVDEGAGMPAEVRDRAREPFFTTKAEGEGTGLGLAIVDSIVATNGGRLEIESEVGKGTCVRIVLPPARSLNVATRARTAG